MRTHEALGWREEGYLMGGLLSHVVLQLLELFCGVCAELVIGFLQNIQLSQNLFLLLTRKPAVRGGGHLGK